jgi:hypothetical protein
MLCWELRSRTGLTGDSALKLFWQPNIEVAKRRLHQSPSAKDIKNVWPVGERRFFD